jgi:hypothetical protein
MPPPNEAYGATITRLTANGKNVSIKGFLLTATAFEQLEAFLEVHGKFQGGSEIPISRAEEISDEHKKDVGL